MIGTQFLSVLSTHVNCDLLSASLPILFRHSSLLPFPSIFLSPFNPLLLFPSFHSNPSLNSPLLIPLSIRIKSNSYTLIGKINSLLIPCFPIWESHLLLLIFGSSVSFISVSFVHKFFVSFSGLLFTIYITFSFSQHSGLSPSAFSHPLLFSFHSFSLFPVFVKWLHSTPWWRIIIAAWLVFIQNLAYCINHFFHKIKHVLKIFNNSSTSVKTNQLNSSNLKDCII